MQQLAADLGDDMGASALLSELLQAIDQINANLALWQEFASGDLFAHVPPSPSPSKVALPPSLLPGAQGAGRGGAPQLSPSPGSQHQAAATPSRHAQSGGSRQVSVERDARPAHSSGSRASGGLSPNNPFAQPADAGQAPPPQSNPFARLAPATTAAAAAAAAAVESAVEARDTNLFASPGHTLQKLPSRGKPGPTVVVYHFPEAQAVRQQDLGSPEPPPRQQPQQQQLQQQQQEPQQQQHHQPQGKEPQPEPPQQQRQQQQQQQQQQHRGTSPLPQGIAHATVAASSSNQHHHFRHPQHPQQQQQQQHPSQHSSPGLPPQLAGTIPTYDLDLEALLLLDDPSAALPFMQLPGHPDAAARQQRQQVAASGAGGPAGAVPGEGGRPDRGVPGPPLRSPPSSARSAAEDNLGLVREQAQEHQAGSWQQPHRGSGHHAHGLVPGQSGSRHSSARHGSQRHADADGYGASGPQELQQEQQAGSGTCSGAPAATSAHSYASSAPAGYRPQLSGAATSAMATAAAGAGWPAQLDALLGDLAHHPYKCQSCLSPSWKMVASEVRRLVRGMQVRLQPPARPGHRRCCSAGGCSAGGCSARSRGYVFMPGSSGARPAPWRRRPQPSYLLPCACPLCPLPPTTTNAPPPYLACRPITRGSCWRSRRRTSWRWRP
jgi:hypothetical protein